MLGFGFRWLEVGVLEVGWRVGVLGYWGVGLSWGWGIESEWAIVAWVSRKDCACLHRRVCSSAGIDSVAAIASDFDVAAAAIETSVSGWIVICGMEGRLWMDG